MIIIFLVLINDIWNRLHGSPIQFDKIVSDNLVESWKLSSNLIKDSEFEDSNKYLYMAKS